MEQLAGSHNVFTSEIIAEMIAEETKGTMFHIETEAPYPADYMECIDLAKKDMNIHARTALKGDANVEDYDVVFLGYPNWWEEVPMAVYTFIEKHLWQGKTVIPFSPMKEVDWEVLRGN